VVPTANEGAGTDGAGTDATGAAAGAAPVLAVGLLAEGLWQPAKAAARKLKRVMREGVRHMTAIYLTIAGPLVEEDKAGSGERAINAAEATTWKEWGMGELWELEEPGLRHIS